MGFCLSAALRKLVLLHFKFLFLFFKIDSLQLFSGFAKHVI